MPSRPTILLLLIALGVITFLDRLAISVAGPRIQAELGIAPQQWGLVLGAFVLAYGLFEIPTGAMGDRWGQRGVLTRIVLWWSAFTALSGAATGYWQLVATRFLFGAGEAGAYPNMAGAVARSFEPAQRARAQGAIWAASRAGGALAPLLVVPLQATVGWRAAFALLGLIGVAWCAVWWACYRDPAATVRHSPTPWRALARSHQMWIIVAMYGTYAWGSWFYFSWLPTYLIRGRHFTEPEMAIFASLPFVLGAAANIAGGFLSDYATRRLGRRWGRVAIGTSALLAAAALLVATALTPSKNAAVALLAAGFGVMDLMLPSAWAICLDIGGAHAGAVSGAMNTAGQLGGFLCTVLFGYIVARYDYNAPLLLIAAMLVVAACLFTRIDATRPLIPTE